jgi:hypothetical protein
MCMRSTTLSEAINQLVSEGYSTDFNLNGKCLVCTAGNIRLHPEDFVIDKFFRFEGMTDPADQSILYAISSEKYNAKGMFVSGYGIYTESVDNELLAKLNNQSIRMR